jgi:hypothetical protein
MAGQWYYSHDHVTHGPFSDAEIRDHAARKMLLETDWLWQGDQERKDAVPAAAAIDFPKLSVSQSAVPDWLADVVAAESAAPTPAPAQTEELPEWLDDLRLWAGLEMPTAAEPSAKAAAEAAPSAPAADQKVPEWLTDLEAPGEPSPVSTAPTPPLAMPIAAPIPTAVAGKIFLATPVTQPTDPSSIPLATPVFAPPANAPSTPNASAPLVAMLREASGFDLDTGRILDHAKFQKWKQEQARVASPGAPAVTNASLLAVFRTARTTIEGWVDDDKNRVFMLQAGPEDLRRHPEIQRILQAYAPYGREMHDKLLRHLDFMVDNRRKYYRAQGQRVQ